MIAYSRSLAPSHTESPQTRQEVRTRSKYGIVGLNFRIPAFSSGHKGPQCSRRIALGKGHDRGNSRAQKDGNHAEIQKTPAPYIGGADNSQHSECNGHLRSGEGHDAKGLDHPVQLEDGRHV